MEIKSGKLSLTIPIGDSESDDSFDYDEYVIGDELDIKNDEEFKRQSELTKSKMNRSVAKKVQGLFKGLYNKASKKIKSSVYRKNSKNIDDSKSVRSHFE